MYMVWVGCIFQLGTFGTIKKGNMHAKDCREVHNRCHDQPLECCFHPVGLPCISSYRILACYFQNRTIAQESKARAHKCPPHLENQLFSGSFIYDNLKYQEQQIRHIKENNTYARHRIPAKYILSVSTCVRSYETCAAVSSLNVERLSAYRKTHKRSL